MLGFKICGAWHDTERKVSVSSWKSSGESCDKAISGSSMEVYNRENRSASRKVSETVNCEFLLTLPNLEFTNIAVLPRRWGGGKCSQHRTNGAPR